MRQRGWFVAAVVAAVAATTPVAARAGDRRTTRIAGPDDVTTAVEVSRATFADSAPVVYVTSVDLFPDGLGAAAAAARHGGPLLSVPAHSLPDAVRDELVRLHPGRIVITGSPVAVDRTVEDQLRSYAPTVERVYGASRYGTAALLAGDVGPGGRVYVINGETYLDAATVNALAGAAGAPVLLVHDRGVPDETAAALRALAPSEIVAVGAWYAIPPALEVSLHDYAPSVMRDAGMDEADAAVLASRSAFPSGASAVVLGGRDSFSPGLAAAVLAAGRGVPTFLTPAACLPATIADELDRLAPADVIVVGGPDAVSDAAASGTRCSVPAAPTDVRIDATVYEGAVEVAWTPIDDPTASYYVFRGPDDAHLAPVGVGRESWIDRDVDGGTSYVYAVATHTTGGTSAPSAPVPVETPHWSPPGPPSGVAAIAIGPTSARLSWNRSSGAVNGYDVYRWSATTIPVRIASTADGQTFFYDWGLAPHHRYTYIVVAEGPGGETAAAPVTLMTFREPSLPMVVRDGLWLRRSSLTTGPADEPATRFETRLGDIPLVGDWDGDGHSSPGVWRQGHFLLRNCWCDGPADIDVAFGSPLATPVVGDWDGDGVDTIGVWLLGTFQLRNTTTPGRPDLTVALGSPGDTPVVGDWDGDGVTTVGVRHSTAWTVTDDATARSTRTVYYGEWSDRPLVGDWDGDGRDTPGVVRGNHWLLKNSFAGGAADVTLFYGLAGDTAVPWR